MSPTCEGTIPGRIGRYRIDHKLGEGGMGVVYAAHDERLARSVAIKTIRHAAANDERCRQRLWREARAAARVTHPNICQLHEIDEDQGQLYIVMELLDGEPLSARLLDGPLPLAEAVQTSLGMLSALDALHRGGVVHRDLKPSNLYLTASGVKLLDFGVSRLQFDATESATCATLPGWILGTPAYLAPERLDDRPIDARSDLFAAGAVMFEMVTSEPAFAKGTIERTLHAVLHEHPPALGGSPAAIGVDRVIQRALQKDPEDRFQSAAAMADALRAAVRHVDSAEPIRLQSMTRLLVLPLRILRPDAETDFLAFSLADAVINSLAGFDSLVVRSSATASRLTLEPLDLENMATKADVNAVLSGTLLRLDDVVRVTTQLAKAPEGEVLWSHTLQLPLTSLFQLQNELATRLVSALALPLSARERRRLTGDVPATPRAYEFYLRANQLSHQAHDWSIARDLYLQCVDEDPQYAPAWARLGRVHRVMAEYAETGREPDLSCAERAFQRALDINPDLSIAHNLYTYQEAELGRAQDAMVRLLARAQTRPSDPELFAGLVQACRYCGLPDAAVAAHHQARR